MRRPEPLPTIDQIRVQLAETGITHVGVTTADVLDDARRDLHDRKAQGLHGEMDFTYRDPDRSTDPRRAVEGAQSGSAAAGESCGVLGVTILTSLDAEAVGVAWGRPSVDVNGEVLRLAGLVRLSGSRRPGKR